MSCLLSVSVFYDRGWIEQSLNKTVYLLNHLVKKQNSFRLKLVARGPTIQGRIFRKIWLPSITQKQVVLRKTGKSLHAFGLKSGQKPMKEQSKHKIEARFGLSMPKNPYNNLLFDHIDRFEFFLIFWVQTLSYLPLLQEGTTAGFLALGSSHNRPCYNIKLNC